MKARKWGWLLTSVLWMSCAMERPPTGSPDDDAQHASAQLKRLETELNAESVSAVPDCERARSLTRSICELAERICAISARHAEEQSVELLCRDSKPRCERAQAQTRTRCGTL